MSTELRQIESISEFTMMFPNSQPDVQYLISGELLNKVRVEFDKGRRALQLLQMIVEFGADA